MPSGEKKPTGPRDARELADRLHSAAIHLLRRLRRVDDAAGLAAPKLSALSVLVFGGPRSLKSLAEAEQVRPPSMTRLVQELETEGYVRRQADPSDGRAVILSATPKATRLLKQGRGRRVELLSERLNEMSAEDARRLSAAIEPLERLHREWK
jgi:DNA-binding MarR family transcriptional regulator